MKKEDWIKKSLELVSTFGIEVLKIDSLSKELKVTKGSFYHHFKNQKEFTFQLLDFWYKDLTLHPIEELNKLSDPYAQLEILDSVIFSKDLNIERHFRAWALTNPFVAKFIEPIDKIRIETLKTIYLRIFLKRSEKEITLLAQYTYSQLIGQLFILPDFSIEKQKELEEFMFQQILKDELC